LCGVKNPEKFREFIESEELDARELKGIMHTRDLVSLLAQTLMKSQRICFNAFVVSAYSTEDEAAAFYVYDNRHEDGILVAGIIRGQIDSVTLN